MNVGKTLFAQVMEFVPWKTFARIIKRHKGDAGVRTLGCADLFRVMAFSQLTWRESLRDIGPKVQMELDRELPQAMEKMRESIERMRTEMPKPWIGPR